MTLKTRRQIADILRQLAWALALLPIGPIAVPAILFHSYHDWEPSKGDRPSAAWRSLEILLSIPLGHFIMVFITWVVIWDLRNFRRIQHEHKVAKNLKCTRKRDARQAKQLAYEAMLASWIDPKKGVDPGYALGA